jgi:3-methyl-2-oxobutanoate hydroxymethyltransferase
MSAQRGTDTVSIHDLARWKREGQRFAVLTAYDHPTAQVLDEAGVPVLLVGDSLGMVVLGYDSTVPVTVEEMLHHTRAVARGARRALVVGDLPFGSFQAGEDAAVATAVRFLKEGGANAVKLEGGGRSVGLTERLVAAGVPVMGHVGLTPQSVNQLGGYRVQGREDDAAERLLADARALAEAGAFAVVLECVPAELGRAVTDALEVPTIGIGAGGGCDAQVLVLHDVLGLSDGPKPRFVKAYANLREQIGDAAKAFQAEVADGDYPGPEHVY